MKTINKKLKRNLITVGAILFIIVDLILVFYAIKTVIGINDNQDSTISDTTNTAEYPTYEIGEEVSARLSSDLSKNFNVLSDDGNTLTLFYKGILSEDTFNYEVDGCSYRDFSNCDKYAQFQDSKISDTLNGYMGKWSNVSSIRLISYNEVMSVAELTTKTYVAQVSGRDTPYEGEYISGPDWLLSSSAFWTSTFSDSNLGYVRVIDPESELTSHSDSMFSSNGIRPVITIGKKYVDKTI